MSELDLDMILRHTIARHLRVSPESLTGDADLDALGLDDDATATSVLEAVGDILEVRFPDDFLDGVYTFAQFTSAVRVAVGACSLALFPGPAPRP